MKERTNVNAEFRPVISSKKCTKKRPNLIDISRGPFVVAFACEKVKVLLKPWNLARLKNIKCWRPLAKSAPCQTTFVRLLFSKTLPLS